MSGFITAAQLPTYLLHGTVRDKLMVCEQWLGVSAGHWRPAGALSACGGWSREFLLPCPWGTGGLAGSKTIGAGEGLLTVCVGVGHKMLVRPWCRCFVLQQRSTCVPVMADPFEVTAIQHDTIAWYATVGTRLSLCGLYGGTWAACSDGINVHDEF